MMYVQGTMVDIRGKKHQDESERSYPKEFPRLESELKHKQTYLYKLHTQQQQTSGTLVQE